MLYTIIYAYLLKRQYILNQIHVIICSWGHKIFKYGLHTCILKSSNQSSVFIGCAILIGCLLSKSTKYLFKCFFTIRPGLDIINYFWGKNYYNDSLNFSSRKFLKTKIVEQVNIPHVSTSTDKKTLRNRQSSHLRKLFPIFDSSEYQNHSKFLIR